MSIFGKIMSSIFGTPAQADEVKGSPDAVPPAATTSASAPATPGTTTVADASSAKGSSPVAAAPAAAAAKASVDVTAILDKLTDESDENDLDWRKSIVDLMKLLGIDSSLKARKTLAQELAYTGDTGDSATMNVWLHKQVMKKLAENGGKIPAELLKH